MSEVIMLGPVPHHPRQRVQLLTQAAEAISRSVGGDPADAVFCLLIAAFRISIVNTTLPADEVLPGLREALDDAARSAAEMFPPKAPVQ